MTIAAARTTTASWMAASAAVLMPAGALSAGNTQLCPYTVSIAGTEVPCGFPYPPEGLSPLGLNNLGHWAGYRNFCGENTDLTFALTWTPEAGLQGLPLPPGSVRTGASAINDRGTVIGWRDGTTNGELHGYWACIWIDGQFVEIPPLGGCPPQSGANAVNNSDVVVGWRNVNDCSPNQVIRDAFVWKDGEITDIDPSTYGFTSAEARDISDTGIIAGILSGPTTIRVFRMVNDELEVLAPLQGSDYCGGASVNDSGQVVGYSHFPAQPGSPAHNIPTVWNGSTPLGLPLLGGYASGVCKSVNSEGVVMGFFTQPLQAGLLATKCALWIDSIPYPLGTLIADPPPFQGGSSLALNDRGQVLCTGGQPVAPQGSAWIMSPAGSPADIDGDCAVNGADLALLLNAWGTREWSPADLSHDGKVDGADLGILLGAWTTR